MKGIKITLLMLIACQAAIAQSKTAEEIAAKHVERLNNIVQLTAEQQVQVKTIVLASTKEIKILKENGQSTPEDRKAIKEAERQKVKELLSDEQKAKLGENHLQHHLEGHDTSKVHKRADHQKSEANKNYLYEKRAAFEKKLSAPEKEAIDKARMILPTQLKGKEAHEALSEEQKAVRKEHRKKIHALLKPIVKEHKKELEEIRANLPERPKSITHKHSGKKPKHMFSYRFLLLH